MTNDEKIVGECIRAAVEGPFFPGALFHTLIGRERREVAAILEDWPESQNIEAQRAVVQSIVSNLLWYPHKGMEAWGDYISAPYREVKAVFARWRGAVSQDV
jgi:hypothetical protein